MQKAHPPQPAPTKKKKQTITPEQRKRWAQNEKLAKERKRLDIELEKLKREAEMLAFALRMERLDKFASKSAWNGISNTNSH